MRVVIKPLGLAFVAVVFVLLAVFAARGCFGPRAAATPADTVGSGSLPILADTAKRTWIFDQVTFFNIAYRRPDGQQNITATWKDMDTREAFQSILNGKQHPAVWAPSGSYWAAALNDAWRRIHSGKNLVDTTDAGSYRVYLRTPLVFLTRADRVAALRPLLDGSRGNPSWRAFHDLCAGTTQVPWGRFRYAVADPLNSNSSFMMLGMILADYGARTGRAGSLAQVPKDPAFGSYLQAMKASLIDDPEANKGEDALCRAYGEDPSCADLIVTYEANALTAAAHNPRLVVIYPNPTPVADQSVVVLNGDWVRPEQRAAARTFLNFLGREDALRDGVRKRYRPVQPTDRITLQPELARYRSSGFQDVFTTIELPPYDAVNDTAFAWRQANAEH